MSLATMFLALLLHASSNRPLYEAMCKRAPLNYMFYVENLTSDQEVLPEKGTFGIVKRGDYLTKTVECFIFEKNVGEVYWQNHDGLAIVFPREK